MYVYEQLSFWNQNYLFRYGLSQSSDECSEAKKCGECISNASCFWCSEAQNTEIEAKCFSKSSDNDIYNQCSNKEDPGNNLEKIKDDDINLGKIMMSRLFLDYIFLTFTPKNCSATICNLI